MAPFGNQNSKGKGITTASSDPDGGPSKRTLQNRKAQREFRKRREARVRELEERCRRYDELGLEANVELQRVARRLKDENDALRNLIINLGHGKLIPSALEGVYQQHPHTPSAASAHSSLAFQLDRDSASTIDHSTSMTASTSRTGRASNNSAAAAAAAAAASSTSSSTHNKSITAASNGNGTASAIGTMGPPSNHNGHRSTTLNMHPSAFGSRSLEPSASTQSNSSSSSSSSSSSTTRGDGGSIETSHAYNPPELLQRSALSSHASAFMSKLGTGMVSGLDASSAQHAHHLQNAEQQRRASAVMAQHIDAAINNSRPGAVPSLLRLDLGNPAAAAAANAQQQHMGGVSSASSSSSQQVKVKQELPSSSAAMRLGPFGSMGLNNIPAPPAPASSTATSVAHTGPIVSYSGSNSNFLPFVQPTSVSEALLNPNPIPFQFNLSQLSQAPTGISPMHTFSSLADQGTWWLSAGGSALTPGQDPNALDEKAMAVAAEQQHELGRSGSQATTTTTTTDGSQFDLTAFLNGGVTPGGSFKMDGNTAISGQSSNNNSTHNSPRRDSGFKSSSIPAPAPAPAAVAAATAAAETAAGLPDSSNHHVLDQWEDKDSSTTTTTTTTNSSSSNNHNKAIPLESGRRTSATAASHASPSSLGAAPSPRPAALHQLASTNSPKKTASTSLSPVSAHSATPASSTGSAPSEPPMPAINAAKQLLLDGAGPMSMSSADAVSGAGALAAIFGGEGYPSLNIPLKRTLSTALGSAGTYDGTTTTTTTAAASLASFAHGSAASAGVPPTKIFRAATPGAAGAMPIGLDNAESTRAFLQLLEQRMAQVDGGLGPLGMYEHLGFRPPSFVAAGANAAAAAGASSGSGSSSGSAPSSTSKMLAAQVTDGAGPSQ
ncbi:hypothetical protein OC842_003973 [Tilletia horrida]|uniref:BZIP domain-containing protein n=1 Tax=Tilletia horrida TaxID=155126 RepID=A0AAN6GAJ8_9BASI|nr:hypothetical protein OC842_003973 [Tilletia horrida]